MAYNMTYKQAINILGLREGHTREEAKKAFKQKARDKHPDNFLDEAEKKKAEEEFKEINAAYNLLYGVSKPFISDDILDDDLREIKEQYINEVFNFCLMEKDGTRQDFMEFCKDYVADLIYSSTMTTFRIAKAKSSLEIKNLFSEYKDFVKSLNEKVRQDFFVKFDLDNRGNLVTNYELPLFQFWVSLRGLGKEIIVRRILNKYSKMEAYKSLKEQIDVIVINSLMDLEFHSLEECRKKIQDILGKIDKLFRDYEKITKKLCSLKTVIYNRYDGAKIKMVENLYDCMSLSYMLDMASLSKKDYDVLVTFFKIRRAYETNMRTDEMLGEIEKLEFLLNGFRVYFKKNEKESILYVLVKMNNEYFIQNMDSGVKEKVDFFSLDESYISLDEFLEQAEFVGKIVNRGFFEKLGVLYSYEGINIVLYHKRLEVMVGDFKNGEDEILLEKYYDKEVLRERINLMVRERLKSSKWMVRERRK